MDWSGIAAKIGTAAPLLGTLIGGPAGAAVGGLVASVLGTNPDPDSIATALQSPDALVKLKQLEADKQVKLRELALDTVKAQITAETQNMTDVNGTMRAEASSEHWQTYSWRPAIGFAVALNVGSSTLIVLGVFVALVLDVQNVNQAIAALPATLGALAALVGATLPILGVASWYRGKMQADPSIPPAVKIPLQGSRQ